MESVADENLFDFLDRFVPFEVNNNRKSLRRELRKLEPIIPEMTRTDTRDMESFKLYLRDVVFNQSVNWEETNPIPGSESDTSLISLMLHIMDYLSRPCHTNENYSVDLLRCKREIAELQKHVDELKIENEKLLTQITKQPLLKSSYLKVMNVFCRSSEKNQSSKKNEEKKPKTVKQLLDDINKLSFEEECESSEDRVVKKVHVCLPGFNSSDDMCPCVEKMAAKISNIMKTELICAICRDVISKPYVLQCGHMFCQMCLHYWNKVKLQCPCCRSVISYDIKVPIESFMVEMSKVILLNCNISRSKFVKTSEQTDSVSQIPKISEALRLWPFQMHSEPVVLSLAEEDSRDHENIFELA